MNMRPLPLPEPPGDPASAADGITRGVGRLFRDRGCAVLREFKLTSERRVDVAALDRKGRFTFIEVKSSLADFRSDRKWPEYLPYCDAFFFAVDGEFPLAELPDDRGLIVADAFGAAVRRPGEMEAMNGQRRRAQILRFALKGADRLEVVLDPRG